MNSNKNNSYRITVEELIAEADKPARTIEFEFEDREDLFQLVDNLKRASGLQPTFAVRLAVALRLLGPMMVQQRKHPLFVDFMPHFKTFMLQLKNTIKSKLS
ncbi:DUF3861 domain-containing protein [Shewanella kaireitica]|uniref:DUF3861 domain-containing protein n=1 Tax=Shewanella kaireitica TaxID=212021 RepID=UPI002010B9D9|nr:DUF3861 domain-containing protein [Shewanella kaireitica]MCL1092836.1 DUF3861 domain-containing protein [Shewanella kaireitica]